MKKLILLGLAIIFFAACESKAPVRYTQSSPEIDVVKGLISDYEAGNWEGWKSRYADSAWIFHNTINDSMSSGQLVQSFKESLKPFSAYKFIADEGDSEMVVDDKGRTWVNYWGVWQGTLEENNKEFTIPVHVTFQMVDQKVVREYGYWNNAPIALALQEIEAVKAATEEAAKE